MIMVPRRIIDLTKRLSSQMSPIMESARILMKPGSRIRAGYGPEAFYVEVGNQAEFFIIKMDGAKPSDGERGSIPREGI